MYTDEATARAGLARDFDDEAVSHNAGEHIRGMAGINGMESFGSTLKQAHKGTFHKIGPKHLDRCAAEFAGKYSVRDVDTLDLTGGVAFGRAGKRLRHSDLTSDKGLDSGARS